MPRLALDLALWAGAAALALAVDRWWLTAAAVFFIGVAPFHDLLILGHEGTHRMVSRRRVLNELAGGFALALAGISNTAHRAFHLKHHRQPHSAADPEFRLFDRVAPGVPGWAYLLIPAAAAAGINQYGLRHRRLRAAVARELLLIALLHAALVWALGWRGYLLFVLAPGLTGLFYASVLRSICEHHAVPEGGAWENARSVATGRLVEFLWSNVNHHLEHHLYPNVPYHRLPELRALLRPEQERRGSALGRGYLRTALALLREPRHFRSDVSSG